MDDDIVTEIIPTPIESTPRFRDDLYGLLNNLREENPVFHDEQFKRYYLTEYDNVKASLRSRDYLTNPHNSIEGSWARGGLREEVSSGNVNMLYADGADHQRLRNLVNDIFTPKAAERWRTRIAQVIERHLDTISGSEFDLIAEFASPVPTVIIAEMMGIPIEHQEDFLAWAESKAKTWGKPNMTETEIAVAAKAQSELELFFADQIEQRRKLFAEPNYDHQQDDLISQMVAAEYDGDTLSDEDIIAQCDLLLVGGIATSADMIGNGIRALLENPDQLELLRNDPSLIDATIEEILRYDTPVPTTNRISHSDISISGCPIAKGETMCLSLAAANHDPAVYDNPNSFDIKRKVIANQSFGGGRHYCIGVSLARIEGQESILRLIQRFPNLRLSDRGFESSDSLAFHGLRNFWLHKH